MSQGILARARLSAMPLTWPGISQIGGTIPDQERSALQEVIDEFGTQVELLLGLVQLPRHASPMFKPWHLAVARDDAQISLVFGAMAGGISNLFWIQQVGGPLAPTALAQWARDEQGWEVTASVQLPLPGDAQLKEKVLVAAAAHVKEMQQAQVLGKLGDLTDRPHLIPHLREFMSDHPDYDKNVFLMMRFAPTEQLTAVHAAIKDTLHARGLRCVRADDRDYTGDVWSNIEVYLTGCKYGIAVFEDIDVRDFNPNVSLELGYMMGRQKRCLILKEKRLPQMPADVVHKLYKPWDAFKIPETVSAEVARWVDVDLGLRR